MQTRYLVSVIASLASIATALVVAPAAAADPDEVSNQPACTSVGDGSEYTGTQTTECATPGNVQIDAQAPAPAYPWDDDFFYGSDFVLGGGGVGPYGGGGARGGR